MQTTIMRAASRKGMMVRCEANKSFNLSKMFPLLNNEVVKKRNESIKENLNKFIAIGSADLKQCYDLAVELDKEHKAALKIKNNDTNESVEVENTEAGDENIFLEKKD